MKFTPKYSTVRGEGGVLEFFFKFQAYSFGHSGGHAKFQNRSFSPSILVKKSEVTTLRGEGGGIRIFLKVPGLFFWSFRRSCKISKS